jgi:peroxiredoxin
MSKATGVEEEWAKIQAEPVALDRVSADDVKKLRANQTGKVLLVNFWSTNCALCAAQFVDLETTFRMYRLRAFDFVTVATDPPDQAAAVLAFLKKQYASSPNKHFASADVTELQSAWGARWKPGTPYTAVIGTDGKVLYEKEGKIDILEVRRAILANMPDTKSYIGQQAYWQAATAERRKK